MIVLVKYIQLYEVSKTIITLSVKFVNLSISSLGIFGNSCPSFLEMGDSLSIDEQHIRYFVFF